MIQANNRCRAIENANASQQQRVSIYRYIAEKGSEDFFEPIVKPEEPCPFGPGSLERVDTYARRLVRGEDLYHPEDERRAATVDEQRRMQETIMAAYRNRKRRW